MYRSLKENYIFSLISTLTGILFPLISFPYASRILEADGMGHVGFFSSIIGYISLFTSLGIPVYAVREIAKVRDNKKLLTITTTEILLLNCILVVLGYITVAILCKYVPVIAIDIPLFLILSLSIFFTAIGCEWFYQGVEDFKYIAIRGVVVRVFYLILLFVFVHSKEDVLIYAGLSVLGTVGNNVFNFFKLRSYIKPQFCLLGKLNITRHIIPTFRLFTLNVVISLYVNLDVVMLGFLKDDMAVGYYDGASKITRLLLALIQSLQSVMVPRFSFLARENNLNLFYQLSQKVVDYVVTLSFPLTIGLFVLAPSFVHLVCGPSYEPAILTLEIMSPIVFMISMSGIFGLQILYPLGQELLVIYSTIVGAIVNLIFCFLLIPLYGSNGAAVAVLLGETSVTISMLIFGRDYIKVKKYTPHYLNCITAGVIMFLAIYIIRLCKLGDIQNVLFVSVIGFLVYVSWLYYKNDAFLFYMLDVVKSKIRCHNEI